MVTLVKLPKLRCFQLLYLSLTQSILRFFVKAKQLAAAISFFTNYVWLDWIGETEFVYVMLGDSRRLLDLVSSKHPKLMLGSFKCRPWFTSTLLLVADSLWTDGWINTKPMFHWFRSDHLVNLVQCEEFCEFCEISDRSTFGWLWMPPLKFWAKVSFGVGTEYAGAGGFSGNKGNCPTKLWPYSDGLIV